MATPSAELARAFEAGELAPEAFKHADHVAVAYEMLSAYEFLDACSRYAASIKVLAERAGAPEKYNATITLAFLSLIAERIALGRHAGCEEFMAQNGDLTSRDVLLQWYSPQRLTCDTARAVFLLPDPA